MRPREDADDDVQSGDGGSESTHHSGDNASNDDHSGVCTDKSRQAFE